VLATGSRAGLDCSPKGDRPGFVEIADDGRTLLIPDRRGNNLIDGLRNLVEDARIGLIFFVPGVNETYRVSGRARVSTDADLRRRFAVNGKEPATVMVVTVEQAFPHCPKALVRSDLWKAASGGRPQGVPTLGDFVAARDPGIKRGAFGAAYSQSIPNEPYQMRGGTLGGLLLLESRTSELCVNEYTAKMTCPRAVCTPPKEPGDGAGGSAHRKSPDPHGPGPSGRGLLKAPAQAGLPYDRPRPRSIWGTE